MWRIALGNREPRSRPALRRAWPRGAS